MLKPEEINTLIQNAKKARENAFVPRSNHNIGSCVLTYDNQYYEGCNVENAISGLGSCAERVAIDHAVSHGKYCFKAIVTVDDKLTYPCGACLQYLLQFYQVNDQNITVIVADFNGNIKTDLLTDLLPKGYLTDHNLERLHNYKSR